MTTNEPNLNCLLQVSMESKGKQDPKIAKVNLILCNKESSTTQLGQLSKVTIACEPNLSSVVYGFRCFGIGKFPKASVLLSPASFKENQNS